MKRYEVRQIAGQKRIALYTTDTLEIKKDEYGFAEACDAGAKKIGIIVGDSKRKKWLSTALASYQIIDNNTGDVMNIKSQEQILQDIGLNAVVEQNREYFDRLK